MELLQEIKKSLISGEKVNIVFIGDSITSCEWVHPNWREIVEYVLKEEITSQVPDWKIPSWGIRCFNFAYDGSATEDILGFMPGILNAKPYLAVFLLNTNDRHRKVPLELFEKRVQQILDELSANCKFVLFGNAIPGNRKEYNEYSREAYAGVAKKLKLKENVLFVDTFSEFGKFDLSKLFTFKSEGNEHLGLKKGDIDYVHPNQLGNAYIAKVFLEHAFGISFDPERFMKETLAGEMFPGY